MYLRRCLRTQHGLILLELVLAMGLIILLCMLSIPSFMVFDHLAVHHELMILSATCRLLQQKACLEEQEQQLFCDEQNNRYLINKKTWHLLPSTVQFGVLTTIQGPPGNSEKRVSRAITFPNNTIIFYPNGTIQAGTVYLCDRNKRWLYALTCAVSLHGYVRTYRYDIDNNTTRWIPFL